MNPVVNDIQFSVALRRKASKGLHALVLATLVCGAGAEGAGWLGVDSTPHLAIEVPAEGVRILRGYQWKWGGNDGERTNVIVTVREGTQVYTNVQMHLKGSAGSFRPFDDKPAVTLHFSKEAKGQRFHGLEKIHLNNSVQDPTFLHEQIARELFNAADIPTPRAAHALVSINGRERGLYVLVEGWTKSFLKRSFKNPEGKLFEGGFAKDVDRLADEDSGGDSCLTPLVTAARNRSTAQRLDRLRAVLDVDRFLTFAALEILLTHADGYCIGHNNYRLFQDLDSGRFVFLPHGMDQLLGTYRSTPDYSITPPFRGVVARGVLESRGARALYLDRLGLLFTNHFAGEKLLLRMDTLADSLRPVASAVSPGWEQSVRRLKSRIERRTASVHRQLLNPRRPDPLDATGTLQLVRWNFRPDNGAPGTGHKTTVDGVDALEIQGAQQTSRTWNSWRITPFLGPGTYEFQARAKLDLAAQDPSTPSAEVVIRISGDRDGFPRTLRSEWNELRHTFELGEASEVELICELRGIQCTALFDLASLKIIRKVAPNPVKS